jgi:putative ABC transport system substrate-binding protein
MKLLSTLKLGWSLLLLSLFVPGAVMAGSDPGRTYHLLILDSQTGTPYADIRAAMLGVLSDSGYRVGENLHLTTHTIGNDVSSGERLLTAALETPPDVVFVGGTTATIAARNVLLGIGLPVVFAGTTDPVGIGVIDDFYQPPKANFTGVSYPVPVEARFRFIRHLLPQAHRIGLIYADMPQSHSYNAWIRQLLEREPLFHDMEVKFLPVQLVVGDQGDMQMARQAVHLVRAIDTEVDAYISPNDQLGSREEFARVIQVESDKPLIGLVRDDVMAGWGALATVYPLHDHIGKQAGAQVRDLFAGRPVSEIEPQRPSCFGYAVDLRLAQKLGLKVPVGILQMAGENIVR